MKRGATTAGWVKAAAWMALAGMVLTTVPVQAEHLKVKKGVPAGAAKKVLPGKYAALHAFKADVLECPEGGPVRKFLLENFDADGNCKLDWSEWQAALEALSKWLEYWAKLFFEKYDVNPKNGKIDEAEARQFVVDVVENNPAVQMVLLILALKYNPIYVLDGKITMDEAKTMLMALAECVVELGVLDDDDGDGVVDITEEEIDAIMDCWPTH